MRLSGKVALVTGAQQGIGRAIAVALAQDGADVGINFLDDRSAAEHVASEVRSIGSRALVVQADVARIEDIQAMVSAVVGELGPPDILVNNAGVFPRAAFLEIQEGDWDHVLNVNLKGVSSAPRPSHEQWLRPVARAPSSTFRHPRSGEIPAAFITQPARPGYWVSRGRWHWRSLPIGFVSTPLPRADRHPAATLWQHRGRDFRPFGEIPLGRIAQPDEIATVAVFLATEEACRITGELIHVNGGAYMA